MKKWTAVFVFFLSLLYAAEDISGFYKSFSDDKKPQCVFGLYEHDGVFYGRIIGTYNDEGVLDDTIYNPEGRAKGVQGNPFTCGLDIVFNLIDGGNKFSGKIIAPDSGKIYRCDMWKEGDDVILRGKLLIFGKNITWYGTKASDFPKDFKLPDMSKFVPNVPIPN
jgi:hypothetical protein